MGGDYSWEAPHMSKWMKDCFYGKLDKIKIHLEEGTPVDSKDFLGHTPLHQCTGAFGNKNLCKIAKILLEMGADINIENRFGCSPLVEPSFALNMYCVNWLLDNG